MPIDIKRPDSIGEDDPLWQYYQQMKAQEKNEYSPEEREYRKTTRESYRDQDLLNQLVPALSRAGAGFGSVGGVAPKSSFENYKFQPAATQDMRMQEMEDKDDGRKNLLYQNLMSGLSSKIAAKDKATIEQEKFNQSLALKKQEADQNRQFKEKMFNETADLRRELSPANMRQQEKEQALQTPYGIANSVDDAKRLKEAHEAKANFDAKIQEMIDLREKHGGGALLNREDVARGKQLSKDLLLEYKNMAKLGVLSQSDEAIINAIIPEDPLAFKAAGLLGQDPILNNLKKFKGDSERDFQTKIKTRTREGLKSYGENPQAPTPPPAEQTKVIGGVTYKKVPGGWAPLDNKMAGQ